MARPNKKKEAKFPQMLIIDAESGVDSNKAMEESEYNNYMSVTANAKEKIKAYEESVAAKEVAFAKLAKLGITEADLKAMGL